MVLCRTTSHLEVTLRAEDDEVCEEAEDDAHSGPEEESPTYKTYSYVRHRENIISSQECQEASSQEAPQDHLVYLGPMFLLLLSAALYQLLATPVTDSQKSLRGYLKYVIENQSYVAESWLNSDQAYFFSSNGLSRLRINHITPLTTQLSLLPANNEDQLTYASRFLEVYDQLAKEKITMAEAMQVVMDFVEEIFKIFLPSPKKFLQGVADSFLTAKKKFKIKAIEYSEDVENYTFEDEKQDTLPQQVTSRRKIVNIGTLCGTRISISRVNREDGWRDDKNTREEITDILTQEDLVIVEHDGLPSQVFQFSVTKKAMGLFDSALLYHEGLVLKDIFPRNGTDVDLELIKSNIKQEVESNPGFQPLHAFGSIKKSCSNTFDIENIKPLEKFYEKMGCLLNRADKLKLIEDPKQWREALLLEKNIKGHREKLGPFGDVQINSKINAIEIDFMFEVLANSWAFGGCADPLKKLLNSDQPWSFWDVYYLLHMSEGIRKVGKKERS